MANPENAPLAAAQPINPIDPAFIADPYPALNALRESTGVAQDAFGMQWYVTRHDDVHRVLNDRALSNDSRNAAAGTADALFREGSDMAAQPSILFLDPPDHTRLRTLVNKAFTPRAIEALRPRAEENAVALLDAVGARDAFDLMEAFAQPFPTIVIAEMIGVDPAEQAHFKEWSDASVRTLDPMLSPEEREKADEANGLLGDYFRRCIDERRTAPRDDLVTRLLAAHEEGDRMSEGEMVTMLILLLVAGNVTTTDLIGNGVLALLTNRDELKKLQEQPSLIPAAVEEILRFDPPVVQNGRIPLQDIEVGGTVIPAYQSIGPSLAAANHDPRVYPEPDRFDVTRSDTHHHSFGGGVHYCLGAPLARMEAQVALAELLRRYPELRLDESQPPLHRTMPGFRGLQTLHVRVD